MLLYKGFWLGGECLWYNTKKTQQNEELLTMLPKQHFLNGHPDNANTCIVMSSLVTAVNFFPYTHNITLQ